MSPLECQIEDAIRKLAALREYAKIVEDAMRSILITVRQVREASRDT